MDDIDRTFDMNETVKLRSKPEIEGVIYQINRVNGIPVTAVLYGWGERFFEELAHLDEEI